MASPSRLVARTHRPGSAPWSFEFNRGEDGDKFKLDETLNSDAMLLGRVSYESSADAWPKRSGVLRQVPQHAEACRLLLTDPEWNNSTVISGDLEEVI